MIRAKIRDIYSLEVGNLDRFVPERVDDFSLGVRVIVGPENGPGEESFDIVVCTPKWLVRECEKHFAVPGRHRLIVAHYDPSRIRSVIMKLIETPSGESWQQVAEKLSRVGLWEFEDYRELPKNNY